uniref:Uncharacterized protein n=1 Tax=Clytia hemisphaerica TaxID=252671 RepID=A0A7M5VAT0_9CNID
LVFSGYLREIVAMKVQSEMSPYLKIQKERYRLFDRFSNDVTIHGFRYMFDQQHWSRRFLWFLLNTLIFALSFLLFYQIIVDFVQYKTTTTLTTLHDDMGEIQFPTITVCPFNSASQTKLQNIFRSLNMTFDPASHKSIEDPLIKQALAKFVTLKAANITNLYSVAALYQLNYTDMTSGDIPKQFMQTPCLFYGKGCTTEDFKTVYTWFGSSMCFQFNSFRKHTTSRKPATLSPIEGFTLLLDLKLYDDFSFGFPAQGISITISSYGHPYKVFDGTTSFVSRPGDLAYVKLSLKKAIRIPQPFPNGCGVEEYQIIRREYPYTQAMCWMDCILQKVYIKCGCVGYEVQDEVTNGTEICGLKENECYLKTRRNFTKTKREDCWAKCPKQCDEISYQVSLSSGNLGNTGIFNRLSRLKSWNKTTEQARDYVR